MIEFLDAKFVMIFLMRLNESFSQIRVHILFIDPLPPMNKIFSLIIQEKRQRSIGISSQIESITLMANADKRSSSNQLKKKDTCPICSNCGYRDIVATETM